MLRTLPITALLAAGLASALPAQGESAPPRAKVARIVPAGKATTDPTELRERRTAKLAKLEQTIFQHGDWLTDYDAARERAAAEGKWILTYFTRSYAP